MVEIRFFVPGQSSRMRGSDACSDKSDAEDDDVDDLSAAQAFHEAIKERGRARPCLGRHHPKLRGGPRPDPQASLRRRHVPGLFAFTRQNVRLQDGVFEHIKVVPSTKRQPPYSLHCMLLPRFPLIVALWPSGCQRCFHLPIPSVSYRILSPIPSFLLNLPLPCYVGKKLLTTGRVTLKRKSPSSHAVKTLFYLVMEEYDLHRWLSEY